jgi:hypothetical protein
LKNLFSRFGKWNEIEKNTPTVENLIFPSRETETENWNFCSNNRTEIENEMQIFRSLKINH